MYKFIFAVVLFFIVKKSSATTWQVGPTRAYAFCSQVDGLVQHGDTIVIDSALYFNDSQVLWNKNDLVIKGIGGRPKLQAGSTIANDASNGKGIFVVSGNNVVIQNIEFANCTVIDNNGAGIRQEGANIFVEKCFFNGNEMGLLCGAIPNCKTTMQYNVFANNGSTLNPGYQHNVYIGNIDTFLFQYNSSIDAIAEGHELKSRAKYNFILYNNIANISTIDSRTIDLPNGGTTVIMGNIIEQGVNSINNNIMAYGGEGLTNLAPHNLFVVNNTFINKKSVGNYIFVQAGTDTLFVKNNIFAGANTGGLIVGTPNFLDSSNNYKNTNIGSVLFADAANFDYNLLAGSPAINQGIAITKSVKNYSLTPLLSYKNEAAFLPRVNDGSIDIGAHEYFINAPLAIGNSTINFTENNTDEKINIASLYPNPVIDQLHINTKLENYTIIVTNAMQQQILKVSNASKQHQLDLRHLPNGIYNVLIIKSNGGAQSFKICKM